MTAYEEYSPLYLPAAFAMTYLIAFALSTCVLVHFLLYHGRRFPNGFKRIRVEDGDIHLKLMQNYPEVPDWWYGTAFVFFFCMAIVAAEVRYFAGLYSLKCAYAKLCTPGLGHGHACLGTGPLRVAAGHICASNRLYLCNDGSSSAFTLHNKHPETNDLSFCRSRLTCLRKLSPGHCFPASPSQICSSRCIQCRPSAKRQHSYRT